jgi:hypothetical protein
VQVICVECGGPLRADEGKFALSTFGDRPQRASSLSVVQVNEAGMPADRPQKITFGEMRDMGVRGVLIYCADYKCWNNAEKPRSAG